MAEQDIAQGLDAMENRAQAIISTMAGGTHVCAADLSFLRTMLTATTMIAKRTDPKIARDAIRDATIRALINDARKGKFDHGSTYPTTAAGRRAARQRRNDQP